MILAAAMFADGQGPKPRELALYEGWQFWGHLPKAGGLLDQPFGLLDSMRMAINIYNAVISYNHNWNSAGWIEDHPEIMKVMLLYWNLREAADG